MAPFATACAEACVATSSSLRRASKPTSHLGTTHSQMRFGVSTDAIMQPSGHSGLRFAATVLMQKTISTVRVRLRIVLLQSSAAVLEEGYTFIPATSMHTIPRSKTIAEAADLLGSLSRHLQRCGGPVAGTGAGANPGYFACGFHAGP